MYMTILYYADNGFYIWVSPNCVCVGGGGGGEGVKKKPHDDI